MLTRRALFASIALLGLAIPVWAAVTQSDTLATDLVRKAAGPVGSKGHAGYYQAGEGTAQVRRIKVNAEGLRELKGARLTIRVLQGTRTFLVAVVTVSSDLKIEYIGNERFPFKLEAGARVQILKGDVVLLEGTLAKPTTTTGGN